MADDQTDDAAPAAPAEDAPETVCVALLDGQGRYFGFREVAKTDVPADAVLVSKLCDLPKDGTYAYRRAQGAFMPVEKGKDEVVNIQAETVGALAGIGFALRAADLPLPPLTLKWLRWFETTLDATALMTKDADGKIVIPVVKPSEFKG